MPNITLPEAVALVISVIGAYIAVRRERSDFGSAAADLAEGAHKILAPLTKRIAQLEKENKKLKASREKGKKVLAKKIKGHLTILKLAAHMIKYAQEHIRKLKSDEAYKDDLLESFPESSSPTNYRKERK